MYFCLKSNISNIVYLCCSNRTTINTTHLRNVSRVQLSVWRMTVTLRALRLSSSSFPSYYFFFLLRVTSNNISPFGFFARGSIWHRKRSLNSASRQRRMRRFRSGVNEAAELQAKVGNNNTALATAGVTSTVLPLFISPNYVALPQRRIKTTTSADTR